MFLYLPSRHCNLHTKLNVERSHLPRVFTNGSILYLVPGVSLAALRAADLKWSCLLGNPNPLRGFWDFLRRLVSELPGSIKKSQGPKSLGLPSSGGRTRTYDLRVMSPTSYQLLHPAILWCKDT